MKRRLVVLLTSIYPFDSGEEFIEGEIEYLAASVERVIVIPVHTPSPKEQTRQVPPNVEVRTIGEFIDLRTQLTTAINTVLSSPPMLFLHSPKKYLIETRFAGSARTRFEGVRRALADVDFHEYDSVVFYAYWLVKTAAVAVWMRDGIDHPNAKAVSRAHRSDLYSDYAWANHLPARKFLVSSLDMIYPISNDGKRELIEKNGAEGDRVVVQRLASKAITETPRKRPSRTHLVSVSSIIPVKRLDLAANAVAEAIRRGVDLQWTHVGDSGPESLQWLRGEIEKLGISKNVDIKGRLTNDATMQLLKSTDFTALMNTSSSEGVPVSIMEAIGSSLPVLCTNVGGSGELIKDGFNGWLLDVEMGASEIADRIAQIDTISNQKYEEMSRAARDTWERLCKPDHNYPRFATMLQEL
ncbi:MAG: glycosyltransferase [Trueperella sp.]|nr:glycosyltransferase [Trueperella sp.]